MGDRGPCPWPSSALRSPSGHRSLRQVETKYFAMLNYHTLLSTNLVDNFRRTNVTKLLSQDAHTVISTSLRQITLVDSSVSGMLSFPVIFPCGFCNLLSSNRTEKRFSPQMPAMQVLKEDQQQRVQ